MTKSETPRLALHHIRVVIKYISKTNRTPIRVGFSTARAICFNLKCNR